MFYFKNQKIMRKLIALFGLAIMLLVSTSSDLFAYRYWVDHVVNGKLVNTWCGGIDGNCLPEVVVSE